MSKPAKHTSKHTITAFATLTDRYEFAIKQALNGANYFTGFIDRSEPGKPFGISCGRADWVEEGEVHIADLHDLIH